MDMDRFASSGDTLFRMKSWKWVLLLVFSLFGGLLLYGFAGFIPELVKNAYASAALSLVACAVLLGIYAALCRKIEKRRVTELSLRRLAPDLTAGCLIGTICIVVSILGMWLAGVYRGRVSTPDMDVIVHDLFFFIFAATGEELICRALLLRMIEERWGTTIALVVSCLAFGFFHYFNDGASVWSCIAITVTAVEAASFLYSRTLWMPIGSHLAWNFVQGNVFGIAVSGHNMGGSFLQADLSGPDILTGGDFGMEASIITVVLTTAIAAGLIWFAVRKGRYLPFRNPWRKQNLAKHNSIES